MIDSIKKYLKKKFIDRACVSLMQILHLFMIESRLNASMLSYPNTFQ